MNETRLAALVRSLSDQIHGLAHTQPVWTAAEVEDILRFVLGTMLITTLDQVAAESAVREN